MILALVALSLSAALCAAGMVSVSRAVESAEGLRALAEAAVRRGDYGGAAAGMRRLAGDWQRRSRLLELFTAHDALSDVKDGVADALVCLENRDITEFYRASAALKAALERMRASEAARVMNLF